VSKDPTAPLTVDQLEALGAAFTNYAAVAKNAGKSGSDVVDLTQLALSDLDVSIEQAQAAVDAARANQGT
jgi:hypothetical protein